VCEPHVSPAGLVEQPTDWPWSIARFWEGRSDVWLRMDDPFEWYGHRSRQVCHRARAVLESVR